MAQLSQTTPRRVIFTNDCAEGTARMIDRAEELGLAIHQSSRIRPGDNPQHEATWRVPTFSSLLPAFGPQFGRFPRYPIGEDQDEQTGGLRCPAYVARSVCGRLPRKIVELRVFAGWARYRVALSIYRFKAKPFGDLNYGT